MEKRYTTLPCSSLLVSWTCKQARKGSSTPTLVPPIPPLCCVQREGVKWFNSRPARPGNARNGKKGWEWDGIRSKAAAGEKKRREERERWPAILLNHI
jgi:hypothetical protein